MIFFFFVIHYMINKNNFPILVINVSYVSCNGAVEAGLIYLRIVTHRAVGEQAG